MRPIRSDSQPHGHLTDGGHDAENSISQRGLPDGETTVKQEEEPHWEPKLDFQGGNDDAKPEFGAHQDSLFFRAKTKAMTMRAETIVDMSKMTSIGWVAIHVVRSPAPRS